jgi:hypothetical protein
MTVARRNAMRITPSPSRPERGTIPPPALAKETRA